MKKLLIAISILCAVLLANHGFALTLSDGKPAEGSAAGTTTDTSNFGTALSAADNTVQKALDTLDDTAAVTTLNNIGDAGADGTIAGGAYELDITSTLDSAGKSAITITNTDADRANATAILTLSDNDSADAEARYLEMINDADGTPSTVYSFSQTGFTSTLPVIVPSEAYDATNWDADTGAPQKDAIRDKIVSMETALNPMTTAGDIIIGGTLGAASRLGIGTAYQLLMTNSGATAPAWTSTLGATGTRLTKGWFTDIESTNAPTVGGVAVALSTGDSSAMTGYPTGAQPLDENLTDQANGIDNRFNSVDLKTSAPTSPEVGDKCVANSIDWDPLSLFAVTITGSSDISFVEGGASADTITDGGSGFVTAGFKVGQIIKVASTTNNNGYYFLTGVAAGTLTLSNVSGGVTDGDLVAEADTSAVIDGGIPYEVTWNGASWIAGEDGNGNRYTKEFQINGVDDAIADSTFVGITQSGIAGAALAVGDVVYLASADGRWELADANSTTAEVNTARGIVTVAAAADGDAFVVGIKGKMRLDTWAWTDNEGYPLYLSDTAGDLTETRTTSASSAVQQLGYILSDDEIFFDPKPIDYSITRYGTDADGITLTCLEATNTLWTATGAQTIGLPAVATCLTGNTTVVTVGAVAVDVDVDNADKMYLDGTLLDDGDEATNGSTAGDQITCIYYGADGYVCQSNSWTDD